MRKLSNESVKSIFDKEGCELLSKYVNHRTKITYRCICGNIDTIRIYDFKRGRRCGCGNIKCAAKKRKKIEEVSEIFKNGGCEFVGDVYKNNHQKLKYRCSCGRESRVSLSGFIQGNRCFECGKEKNRKPYTKIKKRYKKLLTGILKATNKSKISRTAAMLGYTAKQLWDRISTHPNWEKVKDSKWHLDHIFPITAFLTSGIEDVKIINSLENLQPLSAEENLKKRDKYDPILFNEWLKKKG